MGKHNGKHGTLRRGKSLHDWEQNPYRGKERGANFHTAFVMRGRSKQKVVIWRKEKKKRHSQACFSGREEKCSWCWKELEKKWKKRYFEEWWMLEKKWTYSVKYDWRGAWVGKEAWHWWSRENLDIWRGKE